MDEQFSPSCFPWLWRVWVTSQRCSLVLCNSYQKMLSLFELTDWKTIQGFNYVLFACQLGSSSKAFGAYCILSYICATFQTGVTTTLIGRLWVFTGLAPDLPSNVTFPDDDYVGNAKKHSWSDEDHGISETAFRNILEAYLLKKKLKN